MSGAPRVPHGPPPLTVDLHGSGLSTGRYSLDSEYGTVRAHGLDVRVEVGEVPTVTVRREGESAVYIVDSDFSISGTLRLHRTEIAADRLEALEAVAAAARRAVDAIDEKSWWEASPIVAELNAALTALGSPTEDQRP